MRLVEQAHKEIGSILSLGDQAIDATAGNGYDTLFLAQKVGVDGRVFAFDLQQEGIIKTTNLLEENNLFSQVTLFQKCHSKLSMAILPELKGRIQAITFNLGYLPGGNKEIITRPESTLSALQSAYDYLSNDGIISLIAYRGHSGGQIEYEKIKKFISEKNWSFCCPKENLSEKSPVLYLIDKG